MQSFINNNQKSQYICQPSLFTLSALVDTIQSVDVLKFNFTKQSEPIISFGMPPRQFQIDYEIKSDFPTSKTININQK